VDQAAALVEALVDTRSRLIDFAQGCTDEQWVACPLGEADPRPVGVIVDHVADAYEYLARWITTLAAGQEPEITPEIIDGLNARHAADAAGPSCAHVCAHLMASGDTLTALMASLADDQLAEGARPARLADIAARHADSHREELEAALAARA
jgi:DinB superfamily